MQKISLILFIVMALAHTPSMSQREMWMSSTDQNISKRAQSQHGPLYKIRVGAKHVAQMDLIGEDRLLVGLLEDDKSLSMTEYLMISTQNGSVEWRYECDDGDYNLLWIDEQAMVFLIRDRKQQYLKVLDIHSGNELWAKSIDSDSKVLVVPETGQIWINDKNQIEGILIANGQSAWNTTIPIDIDQSHYWLKDKDMVFIFSSTLSAYPIKENGRMAWINTNVHPTASPLVPTFDEKYLYLTCAEGDLVRVNKADGRLLNTLATPYHITNIALRPDKVYLRGFDDSGFNHFTIALDSASLTQQWSLHTDEPVVSNLIQTENQVYFATATRLYSTDIENGNTLFDKKVTTTGRNFPVSLMKKNGSIIYIGELVIAAYDEATGELVYKHGFTPLDGTLHLNGLDASLPVLRDKLAGLQGYEPSGAADMASREAQYYQKLADAKYRELENLRQSGQPNDQLKANLARSQARMATSFSRMQSGLALSFAIVELGYAMQNMMETSATEADIRKQEYFRKTIIEVCNRSLSGDYVFRPNYIYHNRDDNYARISILELVTGKISHHYVSPHYYNYGYWNIVDYENKIIYHHGVGMEPEDYQLSKPRPYPIVRYKTVETFIIAMPFD